ncbi:helix-turn-helix domain-containing protein [Dictyobacter halimunensis]|uniref:helix-turn-helix domain-containing protein n=1 Tax=Dictyobacter halimunensis TaxID=3026934 RepID=UPI0030C73FCC
METQILMSETIFPTIALAPVILEPETGQAMVVKKEQLNLHTALAQLVNTITLPLRLPEMLQLLAELITQALDIDLCLIMLRSQSKDTFHPCSSHPDVRGSSLRIQSLRIDTALWEHLRTFSLQGKIPEITEEEATLLNPLPKSSDHHFICIPLCAGNEQLGLLYCFAQRPIHCDSDEQLMLNTIAQQTALTIKHRRYMEEDMIAQQSVVKALLEDLLSAKPVSEAALQRRAYLLGFDVTKPHVLLLIELSEATEPLEDKRGAGQERLARYNTALTHIKQSLQASYPSILIDEREAGLCCLLPFETVPEAAQLNGQLEPLMQMIWQECAIYMSVGIGTCCQVISDYPRSYAEACEAVQIGACFKAELRCTHFSELGAYRYLYPFVQAHSISDQYQDAVMVVLKYDQRKKTNLLDTLEAYLECGGNIARTACLLDVHRNTLLQRLCRIQKLCPLDLEHMPDRLPWLLALKIYRLRAHQWRGEESVDG